MKPQVNSHHSKNLIRYPLTHLQRGLLYDSLASPRSGLYVQQCICDLRESLDVEKFTQAWEQLLERHAIFRTCFTTKNLDRPEQVVSDSMQLHLEVYDWQVYSADEQEEKLNEYRVSDRSRGFDLSQSPLFRLALFRLNKVHFQLLWTSHHILFDGWSRHRLLEELFKIYDAGVTGTTAELPTAHTFAKFVTWLESQKSSDSELFWRRILDGHDVEPMLDHFRPAVHGGRLGVRVLTEMIRLPHSLSDELRASAKAHGLTLNTMIQGAWSLLLSRYSGRRRVIFGATRAGRGSVPVEARDAVGLYINTVPVPVEVEDDLNLLKWLRTLRALWVDLRAYEHTPLSDISQWSSCTRGAALFDTLLIFNRSTLNDSLQPCGDAWRHRSFRVLSETNYPLVFYCFDGPEIELQIEYDTERFTSHSAIRILGHVQTLLTQFTENLNRPLGTVNVLTFKERQEVLFDWNRWQEVDLENLTVNDLVESQVSRTPDIVAVTHEGQTLSYKALNERSNQLAHYLQQRGLKSGGLVALCLTRSIDLPVTILGILKAGGAYLPLDASCPALRLEAMLKESSPQFLICHASLRSSLPLQSPYNILVLEDLWDDIGTMPRCNLSKMVTGESLAYFMYTSGSTGQPKAVCMPHEPLVNLLVWHQGHPRLRAPARTLQFAPISFDASFQDMVGTLCTGGEVVLIDDDTRRDSIALLEFLDEQAVERLYLPFAALQPLAEAFHHSPRSLSNMKDIISAGEVLRLTPEIKSMMQSLPQCQLHNHYGPTECHVVTSHIMSSCPEDWPDEAPIGKPISNVSIYLLDDRFQPVPVNVTGELYLGGKCVAQGYFQRPELTHERFLSDPFLGESWRMYKTGDQARFQEDGTLVFLGRKDGQIKLRGFRIEPGEIESRLAEHPGVAQVVVVLREDKPGEPCLVGYYETTGEDPVTQPLLFDHLKAHLPTYMIPPILMEVERFPMTPSGKIDRRNLPIPDASYFSFETNFESPRNDTERALAKVWSDIFGIDLIGVHDNFFDLGGHSLLAMKLLTRTEQELGRTSTLKDFFQGPTIRQQSQRLTESHGQAAQAVFVPIRRLAETAGHDDNPLVCAPSLFGEVHEWQKFFESVDLQRSIYGLRIMGETPYWKDNPTMEDIAKGFTELLVRTFHNRPIHLIGHSFGGYLAYEIGQQLVARGIPPLSITIIDTMASREPSEMGGRDCLSMLNNFPRWLVNELTIYGMEELMARFRRKLGALTNRMNYRNSEKSKLPEMNPRGGALDTMFPLSDFPSLYQARLKQGYHAFNIYSPQRTTNLVNYLRSRVRPIIHRHRPDGGWRTVVNAESLVQCSIPGDHGKPLHSRWHSELSGILKDVLLQSEKRSRS